jgi:hypothetical protein
VTLSEQAQKVKTREELAAFVRALHKDLAAGEWENKDLGSYLEGLAGFVGDLEGYFKNKNQKPARPARLEAAGGDPARRHLVRVS